MRPTLSGVPWTFVGEVIQLSFFKIKVNLWRSNLGSRPTVTQLVSKKQLNVTSYDEEHSLPQVNECTFDSGLIEKNGANTNLDIAGWILSGKSLHF